LQIPYASAHNRRDLALPTINVLDPIGTINSFNSFILSLFGGLIQVGQHAISTVDESKKAIESLVGSVLDTAKKEVENIVNKATTDIWTAVNNSAVGTAIRIAQCGEKGVQTVAGGAVKTGKCFSLKLSYLLV
jgi:hypothetical protein